MPLQPGSILHNRYRIESVLGLGGMGAVYRAIDINLGVAVAVKENLFTTEEFARQFRREATILASLRHPNLPRVTDHFVILGEGQYLVMDFIEGQDLRQKLERSGAVGEEEALPWFLETCDALAYLHTRMPSIVHRDIKPGNIKITPEGRAILVDFGLAKVTDEKASTSTGAKAMTPGFSPPEQYGAGRTDPRSDIYSLGATMYAALSANIPEDALERAMGREALTPLRKRVEDISPGTAKAIEKALEVKPEDRFQTVAEFAAALAAGSPSSQPTVARNYPYLERTITSPGKTLVARPRRRARRRLPRRWMAGILGGAALILIIAGAWYAAPEIKARLLAWLSATPQPSSTPTEAVGASQAPGSLTPTESGIILPSPSAGGTQVPTSQPSLEPTLPILWTPTPAITPTGGGVGQIAFASFRAGRPPQIFLVNLDGTGLIQITSTQDGACQPAWSPDGGRLVFTSPCPVRRDTYPGSSLWLINPDGTALEALPTAPGGDYDPAWSPDGRRIAFTSERDGRPQIYVMNVDGTGVSNLSATLAYDSQPAWSPTGTQLMFTSTRSGTEAVWTMADQGEGEQPFSRSGNRESSHADWSHDGQTILYEQQIGGIPRLVAALFDGAQSGFIGNQICSQGPRAAQPMAEARWSIDGTWIVFETWPTGSDHNIAVLSSTCTSYFELVPDPAIDFDPVWRP
jgi:serine/threonine protein kinase